MNTLSIDVKWHIKGFSKYAITSDNKIINLRTGKIKKEFLSNYVRSFDLWNDNDKKCRQSINQLRKLSIKAV